MVYFWSDPHFGHKNILTYCPKRPGSNVDEMNDILVDNYNNIVISSDTTWCLGDFAFMPKNKVPEWVQKLNGHKNLILGNHDLNRPVEFWLDSGFEQVFKLGYGRTLSFPLPAGHGVVTDCSVKFPYFEMCHYPHVEALTAYDHREYLYAHAPHLKSWLLHGHVHDRWKFRDKMINVGVDVWDYKPVSLHEILQHIHVTEKAEQVVPIN